MIEKDLFTRLQRLFSSDVIIRNQGSNQLKVIDVDSIQRSGDVATNSIIDRYNRIFSPTSTSLFGDQLNINWKYQRTMIYSEYDNMDFDAIVASALDIIADESTLKNDMGEVLQIKSGNKDIQQILYNLFYDVLNVEFNLWSWVRQMCKYGDFFVKMEIAEKFGVYNVIPYTAYHIDRQEHYDKDNPNAVRFRFSPDGTFGGSTGYFNAPSSNPKNDTSGIYFENYEMAHFRLLTDVNYLPFGRSYLEPARRIFKQYCLDGNSKIWTPNGYKVIKDIEAGDKVITFNKDTKEFEPSIVKRSEQTGFETVYKLVTPHRTIILTNDHPILTENGDYKALETLTINDRIIVSNNIEIESPIIPQIKTDENDIYIEVNDLGRKYLNNKTTIKCKECGRNLKTFNSGAHLKTHNINIDEYKEKWGNNSTYNITYNKQLIRGDYRIKLNDLKELLQTAGLVYDKNHYNLHYFNQQSKIVDDNIINENISQIIRLFGFMLGDGWIDYSNNTFCFSLGDRLDKSMKYYDYLVGMGFNPNIQKDNSTQAQVNLSNFQLIKLFENLGFKTGTMNKIVPEWVFNLPELLQKEFIYGFTDADGCYVKTSNSWGVGGINENLLEDIKYICQRLGFRVTNISKNSPDFKIINGVEYKITTTCNNFRYKEIEKLSYSVEKISKIIELEKRPVYDIEVESENHNFIADGIVVHNCLMEDSMLIHRISRSPDRRIFYINVGSIPPNEVENFMQKTISSMKRTPLTDSRTGEYNLKYNQQNLLEDFYIPIRGNDTTTKIETAPGLTYDGINDVEYLRDKLFAALKVPKAFMGYEKDLTGKCISPETLIPLLDGRIITVREIINEYNKGIKNYVYSLDENTNNIVPGEIEWAGFTRLNTQIIRVWLDNDKYIDCTPDHKFLTRKGEWKEAQHLIEHESLMPLYLQKSTNKKINNYTEVYNPKTEKYEFVHRLVAEYYNLKEKGKVIHHIDCNKSNNNPSNLDCSMDFWEHRNWHINNTKLCHTESANTKRRNTWVSLGKDIKFRNSQKENWSNNSKNLVKWINDNGASRKGYRKNPSGVCVGCGNNINKIILSPQQQNNKYCSNNCKVKFWKSKSSRITIEKLIESSQNCRNFKELMGILDIKDHNTLNKVFTNLNIDKENFILEYMPLSHNNIYFMNQFPKTNEYYKGEFKNHKVCKIEWITDKIDTCDLTISKYHNFGTEAGVIIHNSTLAAEDIRFARTIDRIQRIILSELYKIALVHLYAQGYRDEELANFELNLTGPSIIYEQEKIALLTQKVDLAKSILESKLLPTSWIYNNLFEFSEDETEEYRDLLIEDQKRAFRYKQIEEEGNDPKITGKSYGTPHDLASLYGKGRTMSEPDNLPVGYGDDLTLGRPQEKSTDRNTQDDFLGKDRLGVKGMKNDNNESDSIKPNFKNNSPLKLEALQIYLKNKSLIESLFKNDKINTKDDEFLLLNEDQIKE